MLRLRQVSLECTTPQLALPRFSEPGQTAKNDDTEDTSSATQEPIRNVLMRLFWEETSPG